VGVIVICNARYLFLINIGMINKQTKQFLDMKV